MNPEIFKQSISDIDQRIYIKFAFQLGKSGKAIERELKQVLGRAALPYSTITRWMRAFQDGRTDVEEARGGAHHVHPDADERIELVKEKLRDNRSWSLTELSLETSIPYSTVRDIIEAKLGYRKILGHWIPHELTEDQKIFRVNASRDNVLRFRRHPKLLDRTLAIDESWIPMSSTATRDQAKSWMLPGEKRPTFVRPELRERKRMLIMAMDRTGIAFWELLDEKKTVTAEVYCDFLERHVKNWMTRSNVKKAIVCHDNARPHVARMVREWMEENQVDTWLHPPYSPDLHPCDYNCFGPLKKRLGPKKRSTWAELIQNLEQAIEVGKVRGQFKGVNDLPNRWERVIEADGEYIQNE